MTSRLSVFFSEGFRPFFFAAGLYAIFSVLVWLFWLAEPFPGWDVIALPFGMIPNHWHAHEMIFGYASAAVAGFLLTAVPNWTGTQGARHLFVTLASLVWLAGRIAIWFSGSINEMLVAVIDLAFLPILIVKIGSQLLKRPKPQNMLFVVLLSMIWVGNVMVHLEWMGVTSDSAEVGLRAGLMGLASMIAILGGRVTPGFTRNAMKRAGAPETSWPVTPEWLNKTTIAGALLLPFFVVLPIPQSVTGALALLAGLVQLARLWHWSTHWTLDKPILLSLHFGMAMLGIGLGLWGLSLLGWGSEVAALHVVGIGAVGGMTLAVMSRAILGHTGRPLVASGPVALGYLLIALSTFSRWAGSELSGDWHFPMLLLSGGLWIAAFLLYSLSIWPLVTTPRVRSGS